VGIRARGEGIMTATLRWGILGTGGIAHAQANDLVENGFTVTAVGSRSIESAREFAESFGIANAHGSYEELVADPEVDVIYVATPHPFHRDNALLAIAAGKHVLVEKAFTINAAQAREVFEAADAAGVIVLEAMWTRFLPHMIRIRELIASGALGEVRTVIADHNQDLPKDPAHRINDPALGGGALLDLGIYPVSFAFDVLGAPQTVQANSSTTATGVDRQTAVILGFPGGRQAVLHTALDTAGPNTAVVLGTKARIEIEPVWYVPTSFRLIASDGSVLEHFDQQVSQRGMQYQAWELERLVEQGRSAGDILPPSETIAIMATLDEIRRQIGLAYPGE
jgi:predicted dehydrogenase